MTAENDVLPTASVATTRGATTPAGNAPNKMATDSRATRCDDRPGISGMNKGPMRMVTVSAVATPATWSGSCFLHPPWAERPHPVC